FNSAKEAENPSKRGGEARRSSPPGRSTLTTSAPASASIRGASGPGRSVGKSRTGTPESGCMGDLGGVSHTTLPTHGARQRLCRRLAWHSACSNGCPRPAGDLPGARMKPPRQFYSPLAIGAPAPLAELPVKLERMIHFIPPHVEKLTAKVKDLIRD